MKRTERNQKRETSVFFIICLILTANCFAHQTDDVFDDTIIHEYFLTFEMDNFIELLQNNFDEGENQYLSAVFEYNGEVYNNVGVRFKGYKSMGYPSAKKPFKIKFDEFVEDQEFHGLNKLSLSNGYGDPSFLREKIVYDVLNEYVPSSRANFVKLYINGSYWGLYTNVEQVGKRYIQKEFGGSEDGNLYKGDPSGDLIWDGNDQENYYRKYELKTNEDENDWSDLVDLIDTINNADYNDFRSELESKFHIHNFLFYSAINHFFVNLDSYICNGHNYYAYHRDDTGKFVHIPWDFNFAFGNGIFGLTADEMLELPLFWQEPNMSRPLVNRMFQYEEYQQIYLKIYQHLIENSLIVENLNTRIDNLADMIRTAVYEDTLKMFTNDEFELNMEDDMSMGNATIFGLKPFVETRFEVISNELSEYEVPSSTTGLYINEFMADNNTIITDETGEYEDWIEIYNDNDDPVNLAGLFITDDPATPDKYKLPDIEIAGKDFVILWADNEIEEGAYHTNFRLSGNGEYIGLFDIDGVLAIDELAFGEQSEDISFGRIPDRGLNWQYFNNPTPGETNIVETISNIYINEIMASNTGTMVDEAGEYEDWIEIYNGNDHDVNLNGFFLTDDSEIPNKWQIPSLAVEANGHLIFWADNDENQGELHTNFCLNGNGEEVLLYTIDGLTVLDNITFGEQEPDISFGRENDGGDELISFTNPTPGFSNYEPTHADDNIVNKPVKLTGNYPNPFNPTTAISYHLSENLPVSLVIYNAKGQLVKTLVNENQSKGEHQIIWNGKDNNNKRVSSGIFFYKINVGRYSSTRKMIMMK